LNTKVQIYLFSLFSLIKIIKTCSHCQICGFVWNAASNCV